MKEHFPALIVVTPLIMALLVSAMSWLNKKLCFPTTVLALLVSLLSSIGLLLRVMSEGTVRYRLGGWSPPWGIAYEADHLNGLILVVVSLAAFLNLIGSKALVAKEFDQKEGPFYTLYLLFVTGLLGILVTGDAFNLYVLLEIASLSGYALIGMGNGRASLAGLNYVFMGTIGASFYLLGIGYLYLATGSLNMADISAILPGILPSNVVFLAFLLCLSGMLIKMAFFPLHGWLPNAYTHAFSTASSLVAPLTTKVMIYVMIRISFFVFPPAFVLTGVDISGALVWFAVVAMVMGSVLALSQKRLKRMLAYIIVAEVGYMVGGFWLGNRLGMNGAILHIANDVMMTLCVFLAAGAISYKINDDRFSALQGIFRKMPFTMAFFMIGALSIIGVPPTCGFFSKWYLISGGIAAGQYGFVAALLFSSLVNAVLFFRIVEIGYYEPFPEGHHAHHARSGPKGGMAEAPLGMLVSLGITAGLLIVMGIYSGDIVNNIIQFAVPL